MPRARPLYGERDKKFFQRLDRENIARSGSAIEYFSLDRGRNVDPLYAEPIAWRYTKFCLEAGHIEYQELDGRDVAVREEGETTILTAKLNISVLEWQSNAPIDARVSAQGHAQQRRPKAGDVIGIQREVWNVVMSNSSGNAINAASFTGYQLELRKRLKFIAQRQIMPQSQHVTGVGDVS